MSDDKPEQQASGRRLLNATAVMASGTMISRALGFVRSVLIVIALGNTTRQADAFNLATVVPNNLYMIFAGGALNTVLVPQIVRHIKSDADKGEAFINRIMTAFLIALALLTAIAYVFTPELMGLWASSWRAPAMAAHWQQLMLMAYITMPQLFFFGAFFLVGQVLNARDKFGPMMWAPIVNNIVTIAVLGAYIGVWGTHGDKSVPFTNEQAWLLAGGSTLGIVLQTAALIPPTRAIGFRYRPRFDLKGQGLGATFHLAKWMLGYVLVIQLVSMLVTQLATSATASATDGGAGYATYNTAYLVWILPHSLLTVSLATAMLPSASRLAAAGDMDGVATETTRTLRLANTFILPASVGLLVLAAPFAMLVFGNGAGARDWPAVAWTLACFAVGLVPYTVQYVCLRGYYALEDTRTPFFLQIAISGANAVLALVLVGFWHSPALVAPFLAIAYAASYFLGAFITWRALKRRLPALHGRPILQQLARLGVAVLPGALVAAVITWWSLDQSRVVIAVCFVASAVIAVASFFVLANRLGIPEASQLVGVLRRRGKGGNEPPPPDAAAVASNDLTGPDVPPAAGATPQPMTYPEPGEGPASSTSATDPDGERLVHTGQVLDERYRLDRCLYRRAGTETWLGFDQMLSRPVLLHVLAPDDPRTLEILDEARKAAPATDSRFLRVLDAVLVEDEPHGSYIVCEYAPGQSLELALKHGPLTEAEAAWMVRELADGLIGMHAQGLYHRELNPDTVVITASGNVKIVGFLVEAALHPDADDTTPGEQLDVEGLGKVLYAALLARWPDGPGYGLQPAPTDSHGRPLLPRQVRAGFSPAINGIVDRILSPVPANRATRLTTALDISRALNDILRGLDASHDLDRRLRYPVHPVHLAKVSDAGLLASPLAAGASLSQRLPVDADRGHHAPGAADSADDDDDDDDDVDGATEAYEFDRNEEATAPFTPVPPPKRDHITEDHAIHAVPTPEPPRTWLKVLMAGFGIVLVLSLIGVLGNAIVSRRGPADPVETYAISSVRDFDPSGDGGDNRENPGQVGNATDGRPGTSWTTERYGRSPDLNGRKPGVGLVVDLGSAKEVSWVRLDLGSGATTAQIRVPSDSAAVVPPMRSENEWRTVKEVPASSGDFTVNLDQPVTTRFVLVYLTRLPQAASGSAYQGSIAEIQVGR